MDTVNRVKLIKESNTSSWQKMRLILHLFLRKSVKQWNWRCGLWENWEKKHGTWWVISNNVTALVRCSHHLEIEAWHLESTLHSSPLCSYFLHFLVFHNIIYFASLPSPMWLPFLHLPFHWLFVYIHIHVWCVYVFTNSYWDNTCAHRKQPQENLYSKGQHIKQGAGSQNLRL